MESPVLSLGSDKEAILDLVTSRSNAQRQEVIAAYKSSYGKVLNCKNTSYFFLIGNYVVLYLYKINT